MKETIARYSNPPLYRRMVAIYGDVSPDDLEQNAAKWQELVGHGFPVDKERTEWKLNIVTKNGGG
jgi:hypothetical protein